MKSAQLKRLLQQLGETQVGVAHRLGISDRNMRRYVAGTLPVPRVVEIALLCLARHSDRRCPKDISLRPKKVVQSKIHPERQCPAD
jgi:hypothetical protein